MPKVTEIEILKMMVYRSENVENKDNSRIIAIYCSPKRSSESRFNPSRDHKAFHALLCTFKGAVKFTLEFLATN